MLVRVVSQDAMGIVLWISFDVEIKNAKRGLSEDLVCGP